MLRSSIWLAAALLLAAPCAAGAEELSLQQRDIVEARLSGSLVMPETALWRYAPLKPYLGSTKLVCGAVNYQDSTRKYQGYHRFYALIDGDQVPLAQIEDDRQDTSGRLHEKLDFLCGAS